MQFKKLHKDIYEIENFISEEEQSELLSYILDLPASEWENNIGSVEWKNNIFWKKTELTEIITDRLLSLFENYSRVVSFEFFHRLNEGEGLRKHTDYGGDMMVEFGGVLYLNDDFIGGDLYYLDLDYRYRPKARSLIFHNSSILHSVEKVLAGPTRYSMSTFVYGDGTTPVKIKEELFNEI